MTSTFKWVNNVKKKFDHYQNFLEKYFSIYFYGITGKFTDSPKLYSLFRLNYLITFLPEWMKINIMFLSLNHFGPIIQNWCREPWKSLYRGKVTIPHVQSSTNWRLECWWDEEYFFAYNKLPNLQLINSAYAVPSPPPV